MTLAVGLFEAVFFRGWLQLRFEAAFGVVPGLLAAAACYSLYHVGYGMDRAEMLFLFGYGLTFGAMFRLTRNVFVLWPFYTPVGSFYSNIRSGLELPFEATYGFVLVLALMAAAIATGALLRHRRSRSHAMATVARARGRKKSQLPGHSLFGRRRAAAGAVQIQCAFETAFGEEGSVVQTLPCGRGVPSRCGLPGAGRYRQEFAARQIPRQPRTTAGILLLRRATAVVQRPGRRSPRRFCAKRPAEHR